MMDQATVDNLLKDEYLLLQKRIEEFDGRLLTTKAWSVTFAAGAIGLAWQQSNPRLLLVSAISAFAFWMVEAVVKAHQRAHYPRLDEIEDHFAGGPRTVPFQISSSWREAFTAKGRGRRFVEQALFASVCMPHILIIATALGLFWSRRP